MVGAEDEKSRESLVPLRTDPVGLNPESRSDFGPSKGHDGLRLGLFPLQWKGRLRSVGDSGGPCGEGGEQVVREVPGSLKDGNFKSAS